jgi:hypothetical protein
LRNDTTAVTNVDLSGKPASGFSAFAEGETVTLITVAVFYSVTVFLQAYDVDHLTEVVESNSSAPDWLTGEAVERAAEYATQRAKNRGENSALDSGESHYLITTNWSSFTDDWGFSGGSANQVAIGTLNETAGEQADLFEDAEVLQTDWLRSGDGRKKQAELYEDKEVVSEFNGSVGDMWIPHAAQDYLCIIELTSELLHGEAELAEAM